MWCCGSTKWIGGVCVESMGAIGWWVVWVWFVCFFVMIRRPPRSTQSRSSAASDVYKRQASVWARGYKTERKMCIECGDVFVPWRKDQVYCHPVSYTHLRAHETPEHLVCRLLLEKKKINQTNLHATSQTYQQQSV